MEAARRTDDFDVDCDVDGALLAGSDTLVASSVNRLDLHEVQISITVSVHVVRQLAVPVLGIQPRPPELRRYPTLGSAADRRVVAKLQGLLDSHWQKLQPLCTGHATPNLSVAI